MGVVLECILQLLSLIQNFELCPGFYFDYFTFSHVTYIFLDIYWLLLVTCNTLLYTRILDVFPVAAFPVGMFKISNLFMLSTVNE